MNTRIETDSMGEVSVPAERLWGAQTQRSLAHFAISEERMPLSVVRALALVKKAAAQVNAELGRLDHERAQAIAAAADEVIAGRHDQEFPLRVWQTGSGTQSNMNVNEVLANRASELMGGGRGVERRVHPNDHVNRSQSSNDVFPTAMNIACLSALHKKVLPNLKSLERALNGKAVAFATIVKIGRTHLQDATPLSLGQEISGWVAQLDHAHRHLASGLGHLCELALGGTAVGTGLNTHPEYAERVAKALAELTQLPLVTAPNKFESLAAHDALVFAHGGLKSLAAALMKLANDVRWLASGPRCGIGELLLPENEPGSSIMPGKVNPTQCEAMLMCCTQVLGNDVAIGIAGSSGNFELNVCKPLMAHAFIQSATLLADAMSSFQTHLVEGLEPNRARIDELLHRSLMLVTALSPHIGYERAAEVAHRAHASGRSLKEVATEMGVVSAEEFERLVRPEQMTAPDGLAAG